MAPGLVAELTVTGHWLFRQRSYVPVVLVVYLLGHTALSPGVAGGESWTQFWLGLGLVLGIIGLAIRAITAGRVQSGTSGRGTTKMRAEALNTADAYSLVRHPLYLGNLAMWMGTAAFVGQPMVLALVALLFWVYYERIMIAEESFLHRKFGEQFESWADRTPALFPTAGSSWRRSDRSFSLRYALGRDYPAIWGFVVTTFAIQLVRVWAEGEGARVSLLWWIYLLAGTATYVVLRTLKRRTRLLDAPRR